MKETNFSQMKSHLTLLPQLSLVFSQQSPMRTSTLQLWLNIDKEAWHSRFYLPVRVKIILHVIFHAGGFTDITLYTCTTHRKETWELVQSVASPQYNYQSFQTFLIYSVTSEDLLGLWYSGKFWMKLHFDQKKRLQGAKNQLNHKNYYFEQDIV